MHAISALIFLKTGTFVTQDFSKLHFQQNPSSEIFNPLKLKIFLTGANPKDNSF